MKYSKLWVSEMLGDWVGYFLTHTFTHDYIEAKGNTHTTLVTSLGGFCPVVWSNFFSFQHKKK
jgi:hypothetical protein